MKEIIGNSADDLFVLAAIELLENGVYSSPRGLKVLELENVFLTLKDISKSVVQLDSRNLNTSYLKGELDWYKSGSLEVKDIAKYSNFWTKIANPNGTVNSNYGYLAMYERHNGKTQLDWVIDSIKDDPNTRQAIINYNQPKHKFKGNKDFVCTMYQSFRQKDGKIDSTVSMRSNDLIFGLSYDLPWFTYLQSKVAKETGYKFGIYNHHTLNLHVYEKHFKMLDDIANEKQSKLFK